MPLFDKLRQRIRAGSSGPRNTGTMADGSPRQVNPFWANCERKYVLLLQSCSRRRPPSEDLTMSSAARTIAAWGGDRAFEKVWGHEYIFKYSFVAASFVATKPPFDANVLEKLPIKISGPPIAF